MGSDESLKHYLVNELEKSGSEVAGFMADELKFGKRSLKETKAHSVAYAQDKHAKALDAFREKIDAPFDSITLGS